MTNPDSEYLAQIDKHIRTYEQVVSYAPNQTYIGNITPEELGKIESPWHDKKTEGTRQGKMGEIMPQDEFIGMLKMADAFGLVKIDKDFMGGVKEKLTSHGLFTEEDIKKLGEVAKEEFSKAKAAGLDKIIAGFVKDEKPKETEKVEMPEKEVVTGSVSGIDIIDLEDAVESLWKAGIYAESGMGCTGPMVMVSEKKLEKALAVLADAGYVSRESLTC